MIQLVLSTLPIDDVPGRVALTTFFEDIRPLRGSASLIDWRLNGRLSELILQNRISGQFLESLIMPSEGRVAAQELLVFGLGSSEQLTEKRFDQAISTLIEKLTRLKSSDIVISLGDLSHDFMSWRTLLRNFTGALTHKQKDFQVVCSEGPKWISEAKKRNMDFGPDVELSFA